MDVDAEQVQVRDGWYVQPLSADAASTELTSVTMYAAAAAVPAGDGKRGEKKETWLQVKDVHSKHPDG